MRPRTASTSDIRESPTVAAWKHRLGLAPDKSESILHRTFFIEVLGVGSESRETEIFPPLCDMSAPIVTTIPRRKSFTTLPFERGMYVEIDSRGEDQDPVRQEKRSPLMLQAREIWRTVQLQSVWRPMVHSLPLSIL
jgi:hypothetical protein